MKRWGRPSAFMRVVKGRKLDSAFKVDSAFGGRFTFMVNAKSHSFKVESALIVNARIHCKIGGCSLAVPILQ
jgi:hypothetical protein